MGYRLLRGIEVLLVLQGTPAMVTGTVRDDQTGAPIAGAVVALTDLDRDAVTDPEGRYVLTAVPAGPNHLTFRVLGYAPRSLHALVPAEGRLEINISLRRRPVPLAAVEVRAPVIVRGADIGDSAAFPDRGMSIAAVLNHPMLAEPDAFQALAGGDMVVKPESPSGVHIRGGGAEHTAYLLDGIPIFSPYHAAGTFSAWNPDALARLHVASYSPARGHPHSLSGAIEGVTRTPGTRFRAQGSVSTTQARLTADGPLGRSGVGYLLSMRTGFPGIIAPKDEASYIRGETGDALTKVEAPVFGGRMRLLGYVSENDISAAAVAAEDDGSSAGSERNAFEWRSQSVGGEWNRAFATGTIRVLSWSAAADARSRWSTPEARLDLRAVRRDAGIFAAASRQSRHATTFAGIRIERSRTAYRVTSSAALDPLSKLTEHTAIASAFAQQTRALGQGMEIDLGASFAAAGGDMRLGPRVRFRWQSSPYLMFAGTHARAHQFAQSLRNAESVVGSLFPFDLFVGANRGNVPVARSDESTIAANYQPASGVRLAAEVYTRTFEGLLLPAPRSSEPFTTGAFAVGSGGAVGLAVDLSVSRTRYGLVGSYGLQRVRFEYGDSTYVPDHGTTHLLEGGVIIFPSATASIRLGATAGFGRRTTTASAGFEWEACNLLDRGCEFGGSPRYTDEPIGTKAVPAYLRLDIGARKHWHLEFGGRDAMIAIFGTVTNILGRKNVLTFVRNSATGEPAAITMRPLSPLVVGLDWRL